MSSNDVDINSHSGLVAVDHVLVSLEKWAVLMGSAINRSLTSAHFSISITLYFLTTYHSHL